MCAHTHTSSSAHVSTYPSIPLRIQADFDRLGLASYSKLRVVRQDQLMLCNTYPLLMLVPKSFPEDDLHAVIGQAEETME
jgi:hypothetical protein